MKRKPRLDPPTRSTKNRALTAEIVERPHDEEGDRRWDRAITMLLEAGRSTADPAA